LFASAGRADATVGARFQLDCDASVDDAAVRARCQRAADARVDDAAVCARRQLRRSSSKFRQFQPPLA